MRKWGGKIIETNYHEDTFRPRYFVTGEALSDWESCREISRLVPAFWPYEIAEVTTMEIIKHRLSVQSFGK